MSDATSLFNNAELALASYSALQNGTTADQDQIRALTQATGAQMSLTQATEFARRYPTVVTSFDDPTTGLQVTVFKDTAGGLPGNLTVAFRGTTVPEDLPTGTDIVFRGAAYEQIAAMYSWWLREASPNGQVVAQYRVRAYDSDGGGTPPVGALELYSQTIPTSSGFKTRRWVLESAPSVQASGLLFGALSGDADSRVDVTGHSLGGHLSMAFSSLFATQTGQVTVFNAPGFIDNSTNQSFFDALGGVIPASVSITNVAADESLVDNSPFNWIAGMHSRPGMQINVAIEKQANSDEPNPFRPALNHSIAALTDSLAVFNLLSTLSPTITTSDYRAILAAAAMGTAASYERIVDALETLIGTDNQPMPVGNNQRDKLYAAIAALHTAIDDRSLFGTVTIAPLTTVDAASLIQGANGLPDAAPEVALAYRYALRELNPFIVTGNAGLYVLRNLNGELELHDPATRTGALTAEWIADRSEFLAWKNIANTLNTTGISNVQSAETWRYVDLPQKLTVNVAGALVGSAPPAISRWAVFGGDGADAVVGGGWEDRMYGGDATDWMEGKAGNDYLEGGEGLDIYAYGAEKNLLFPDRNDGADTVRDIDGKGVLRYTFTGITGGPQSTIIADASVKLSGTQWQSAEGKFTYTKEGADLVVTINGDAGGSLRLRDFKDGDLNIRLWEGRSNPQTARDIIGDRVPRDFDPVTPGIQTQFDDLGNVIVTTEVEPDRQDLLLGDRPTFADPETLGEKFDAGGGNDIIFSDRPNTQADNGLGNADWIIAGAGRDWVEAGAGNDLIEAGTFSFAGIESGNIVDGGTGDDELYAERKISLQQAILQGNQNNPTNVKGDFLSGGAGRDWIVGAAANDALLGGGDQDLIVGGAGDDNLWGDSGEVTNNLGWSVTRTPPQGTQGSYQVTLDGVFTGDTSDGAADVIYGGSGADWAFGGKGDDFVDGGSGNDVLFGEAHSDILIGGEGNDVLIGDNPGVVVTADEGSDYLDGGAGNDILQGNGGDDILIGGSGADTLSGGAGKDIYVFNKGDGADTLFDASEGPEKSILVFGEGFNPNALTIRPGSLIVDFGDSDSVHITSFDVYDPNSAPAFDSLLFDDGTILSFADVIGLGFDFDGTEESDDQHDVGHPILIGTAFNDRIRGHGGNDTLIGLQGKDTLDGDAGNDQLFGDEGDDILNGGAGSDRLIGGDGDDQLHAGADRDALWGGTGNDTLEGGAGEDFLFGELGDDTYVFDEQDTVWDPLGATTIAFTGDERLEDIEVRQLIVNSLPVYAIKRAPAAGGDPFAFGMGLTLSSADQLAGMTFTDGTVLTGEDVLHQTLVDEQGIAGGASDDLIEGYAGGDHLTGGEGNDTVLGLRGNDRLEGNAGDDQLEGGSGNDELSGGAGADTLIGGAGNDNLSGAVGSDLYVYARGDGQDVIADNGDTAATDVLRLDGLLSEDVTLSHEAGGDLRIALNDLSGSITVTDYYNTPFNRIERVVFADGATVEAAELNALAVPPIEGGAGDDVLTGTPYVDTLLGHDGADTLGGRGGNDILDGGAGVDTYKLSLLAGNATLVEDGTDNSVIRIPDGLKFSDLEVQRSGDDLVLGVRGSQGSATVPGYYAGQTNWTVTTAAGLSKSLADLIAYLEQNAQPAQTVQEFEQNYLDDAHRQYQIYLASFNASGDIRVNVQAPSDSATILRNPPFGETEESGLICLNIADITAGGSANELYLRQSNSVIADAGAGHDLIDNQGFAFDNSLPFASIGSFLYGNDGDDKIVGTWEADTLIGGAGNDYVAGSDGNDTYIVFDADSGTDIIDEVLTSVNLPGGHFAFAGGRDSTDTLEFVGVNFEDVAFSKGQFNAAAVGGTGTFTTLDLSWGTDRHTRVILPNPTDTLLAAFPGESYGIETIRFADGTVLTLDDQLTLAPSLPSIIFGGDGADTIIGTAGNDTIYGGPGNDSISGAGGDDVIYGEAGNDSLFGDVGNDVLDGGPGDDILRGWAGDNIYRFGYGGGNDSIISFSQMPPLPPFFISTPPSFDRLEFLPGVDPEDVILERPSNSQFSGFIFKLNGSQDQVFSSNWFIGGPGGSGIRQVTFADGTVWSRTWINAQLPATLFTLTESADTFSANSIGSFFKFEVHGFGGDDIITGGLNADVLNGGLGNDQLNGGLENDTLIGGAGNDTLSGGEGSDTYVFDLGGGADTISELDALAPADVDTLRFGAGVLPDAITMALDSDLHIRISGTSDEVKVLDWNGSGGSRKIERIEFADGTVWDLADIEAHMPGAPINSSGANDVVTGTSFSETLQGGQGGEWLTGGGGNDNLIGGAGNDLLFGGAGDDTYVFNLGDGVDTVFDPSTPDESNAVVFGDGITPDSLTLGLGSLLVRVGEAGDAIHFQSFDPQHPYVARDVDRFVFADGTELTYEALLARGFDIGGTSGNDNLAGTAIEDRISGNTGDDTITSGDGNDTLDGGAGNDTLYGGAGSDTYWFGPGSGGDFIEDSAGDLDTIVLGGEITEEAITVSRNGSRIGLRINGTADEFSIRQEEGTGFQIERVQFADGTVWDAATLESKATIANTPPLLLTPLADQSAPEDAAFSFTLPADTFFDADASDTLAYAAARADGTPLLAWLGFDPLTRSFTGTPANEDVGAFEVAVTATDTAGESVSDRFYLTVINVNDAPALSAPLVDQFANQNAPFALVVPAGAFTDVDAGDTLTLNAALADDSALPAWLAFDSASRSFSGTPSEFDVGDLDIRFTAADNAGAAASDTITLSVSDASTVDETHLGTRHRDVIVTGFANDLIDAGEGNDLVRSGAGRDIMLGGEGNDRLEGGLGNDLYVHEQHGGNDEIEETGGADTLLMGEGIAPGIVRLERHYDDLLVDLKGRDGSVTVKGWFASDAQKVERIEFADGTAWDAQYIRSHLNLVKPPKPVQDDDDDYPDHGHHHDHDDHGGKSSNKYDDDRDGQSRQKRDRMAELLEAYLGNKPRHDFETLANDVERQDWPGEALTAQEIAQRWQRVSRYVNGLSDERDDDARHGAGELFGFDALSLLGGGGSGAAFGHAGSTGATRGFANLKTLQGLEEGFQRLGS